jgi:predicted negative regulator of RcsB-dependent stress response
MPTLSTTDDTPEREVFWERYKKEVMAVFILALLAVAAFGGYRFYSERRESAGAAALAGAKSQAEYQKVISDYSGTAAGASAYLLLADSLRAEKKFAEANTSLETFLNKFPGHELTGTARLAIAGNLEALGKNDEALVAYQRLVAADPRGFTAPIALYSQIHLLKDKKQILEARKVCETLMTDYRESRLAPDAQYQLRLLKVPDAPATPASSPAASVAPPPPAAAPAAPPSAQSVAPAAPPAPKTSASPKKP